MRRTAYTTDTSSDAYAVQVELLRRMSPERRLRRTLAFSRQVRRMAMDALRRRHPGLDDVDIRRKFVESTYGTDLPDVGGEKWSVRMDEPEELVAALSPVVDALRHLSLRHYVGGSVASSFHGATRSTMDVDLVCDFPEDKVTSFMRLIGSDYYASETAIRDAVIRKSCFNLIHLPTSFKVDVFVSRGRPFDVDAMERASMQRIGETRFVDVPIATAEDSIVSKLEWYRLTEETSERQWDDVSRLIDVIGDGLDRDYVRRASRSVGVQDLLVRLLAEE